MSAKPHFDLTQLLQKEGFDDEEIVYLLSLEAPADCEALRAAAYRKTTELVGDKVYYRGLIEVSNICTSDCRYCGIRKDNHEVGRYAMTRAEIAAAAKFAADHDYGNICLQAGERNDPQFVAFISDCLREIHEVTRSDKLPHGVGVTLSLGDQSEETFEAWAKASGNRDQLRYLARFETSNPALFNFLHHTPHKKNKVLEHRLESLRRLKALGYQVGTGVMIGIPGQTLRDLCADIRLFQAIDADMIGMGPYLMCEGADLKTLGQTENQRLLRLSLNMIAVTRLVLGDVNIAAATALQVLDARGRELGIAHGANVIMPNLTPLKYRGDYQLYDKKPNLTDDPQFFAEDLQGRIESTGRKIGWGLSGSSKKWLKRNAKIENDR